jgi:hypothetical protein
MKRNEPVPTAAMGRKPLFLGSLESNDPLRFCHREKYTNTFSRIGQKAPLLKEGGHKGF